MVNHGLDVGQAEGLVIESALFAICAFPHDKQKGTAALLGKRISQFRGR